MDRQESQIRALWTHELSQMARAQEQFRHVPLPDFIASATKSPSNRPSRMLGDLALGGIAAPEDDDASRTPAVEFIQKFGRKGVDVARPHPHDDIARPDPRSHHPRKQESTRHIAGRSRDLFQNSS